MNHSGVTTQAISAIRELRGQHARVNDCRSIAGGGINQAFELTLDSGEQLFIKVASPGVPCPGMFEAEAAALQRIAASRTIQVPETL